MIAFLGAHSAPLPGCLVCQTHPQHSCMPPLSTISNTDSKPCCCGAGFGVQAFVQGEGALGSLAKFSGSFDPIESVVEVGACMFDPWQPALLAWSCRRGLTANVNLSFITKHPCTFRPWRVLWVLWRVPSSRQLDEFGSTPWRLACHLQCYGLLRHLHGYRCSMYNGWQLGLASADIEASFAGAGRRIKCTRVSTPSAYCS